VPDRGPGAGYRSRESPTRFRPVRSLGGDFRDSFFHHEPATVRPAEVGRVSGDRAAGEEPSVNGSRTGNVEQEHAFDGRPPSAEAFTRRPAPVVLERDALGIVGAVGAQSKSNRYVPGWS